MEKRICSKCKVEKPLTDFYINNRNPHGYHYSCKECGRKYKLENKEKSLLSDKLYRENNREKIRESQKNYAETHKDKISAYNDAHKEERRLYKKEYRKNNKEKIQQYGKDYYQNNKPSIYAYIAQKQETDPLFKSRLRIRQIMLESFKRKNTKKNNKTEKILGCSFQFFKGYIEGKFKKGMTWDNQGEWHYDHIIPLSIAKTEEEIIKLCHYTNFQPLWAKDNMQKSDTVPYNVQFKLL